MLRGSLVMTCDTTCTGPPSDCSIAATSATALLHLALDEKVFAVRRDNASGLEIRRLPLRAAFSSNDDNGGTRPYPSPGLWLRENLAQRVLPRSSRAMLGTRVPDDGLPTKCKRTEPSELIQSFDRCGGLHFTFAHPARLPLSTRYRNVLLLPI